MVRRVSCVDWSGATPAAFPARLGRLFGVGVSRLPSGPARLVQDLVYEAMALALALASAVPVRHGP